MIRQSGYVGFPAILLTFSLLLLVLAAGFVVGRVVVARAYLQMAPKFESAEAPPAEVGAQEAAPEPAQRAPGEVYVPPPAPPEPVEEPEEGAEGIETGDESGGEEPGRSAAPASESAESGRSQQPQAGSERQAVEEGAEPAPVEPSEAEAGNYSIQVGLFTSRQGARRVVDELARTGYQARIEPERRGSQELYRVLTGRYRTEYAARKAIEQLRREGFDAFLVER